MTAISKIINYSLKPIGLRLIRNRHYNNLADFEERMSRPVMSDKNAIPDFARVFFPQVKIADKRLRTGAREHTIMAKELGSIIDIERFKNKTVLEIGPKFGFHSLWIDKNLHPEYFLHQTLHPQTIHQTRL